MQTPAERFFELLQEIVDNGESIKTSLLAIETAVKASTEATIKQVDESHESNNLKIQILGQIAKNNLVKITEGKEDFIKSNAQLLAEQNHILTAMVQAYLSSSNYKPLVVKPVTEADNPLKNKTP